MINLINFEENSKKIERTEASNETDLELEKHAVRSADCCLRNTAELDNKKDANKFQK